MATGFGREDDHMDLPPGFRFHPTDEELITHYLINKVVDSTFAAKAIGEVDMNRIEPWELPRWAKMGEKEWYFFSVRDKKYPTGLRTNRATDAGYWKATGKDKEIIRGKSVVGMKKTLVFYKGRAPKGEKTNWVIHEYRLEGKSSSQTLPKAAKNEWVICRVFHKSSSDKRLNISNELASAPMPMPMPMLTSPASFEDGRVIKSESLAVPCFSTPINPFEPNSNGNYSFPVQEFQFPLPVQDQTFLKGSHGFQMDGEMGTGSQETGLSSEMNTEISSVMSNLEMGKRGFEAPPTSVGPLDMDCFWNYGM